MQKLLSLSELRLDYVRGKIDKKTLEGLIFQYLLDNFERYRQFNGDREKWIDFIAWLYPRLSRAIDYYQETGASFDTYISAIIQWSCKEYKDREAQHHTTEYIIWKAKAEELSVKDQESAYEEKLESSQRILWPSIKLSSRHIIILLLKSYYFITEDFFDRVVESTGIGREKLREMLDQIHQLRLSRELEYKEFQERIYCQYYRCLSYQKRLASAYAGTSRYEKLKGFSERAQAKYLAMKKRQKGMRMEATNRQIANILNIPKGTVDSALHTIREKWRLASTTESIPAFHPLPRDSGYPIARTAAQ